MHPSMEEERYVPESTWLTLSSKTLHGMMIAAMLATAVSLFLMSSGMYETSIVPIVSVIGVAALGFVLVKAFDHFRVEGVPLLE